MTFCFHTKKKKCLIPHFIYPIHLTIEPLDESYLKEKEYKTCSSDPKKNKLSSVQGL